MAGGKNAREPKGAILGISYGSSLVNGRQLGAITKRLAPEIAAMRAAAQGGGYADERASINLPVDDALRKRSVELAAKHRGATFILIVGIGGSNLGFMAVQEALLSQLHNAVAAPRIYCADTVDERKTRLLDGLLDAALERGEKVLVNVISKSGATTETIANFLVFEETLRRHNALSSVVITTDEGSRLWKLAEERGFARLPIPSLVGGRYSVLSPVGIFPLAVAGIDVSELLRGAAEMREACLSDATSNPSANPAAVLAAVQYYHACAAPRAKRRNIAEMFLFSTDLETMGKWWRQLLAESCGKESSRTGKAVHSGVTPVVSVGSTDLHSVAQLGLGGPQDKLTTFVTIEPSPVAQPLRSDPGFEALVPHIDAKTLPGIMEAIAQGTMSAYSASQRPYCAIRLGDRSARSVGAFMELKMMETIYLAALLGVNAFDQPAVEAYKERTRAILAGK